MSPKKNPWECYSMHGCVHTNEDYTVMQTSIYIFIHRWLAGSYELENRAFLEVASMMVTWWIVGLLLFA